MAVQALPLATMVPVRRILKAPKTSGSVCNWCWVAVDKLYAFFGFHGTPLGAGIAFVCCFEHHAGSSVVAVFVGGLFFDDLSVEILGGVGELVIGFRLVVGIFNAIINKWFEAEFAVVSASPSRVNRDDKEVISSVSLMEI